MPSSKDIQKQVEKVISDWGKYLSIELGKSLNIAINKRGSKVQEAALHFNQVIKSDSNGVTCTIIATSRNSKDASYWQVIENGRRKGAKMPPIGAIGSDWMVNNNIDPRKAIQKMSGSKKLLQYDKAVKSFSYIVGRSMKAKGIKPKPFVDKVINQESFNLLKDRLTPLLGEKFKLEIKGL